MSIAEKLNQLAAPVAPSFGYDELLQRHERRRHQARVRQRSARFVAAGVVLALVAASAWRLEREDGSQSTIAESVEASQPESVEAYPRLVRADSYLAVAALEDHIASLDEALNEARLARAGGAEVARLESTRAELVDSWARVRYAQMVSNRY